MGKCLRRESNLTMTKMKSLILFVQILTASNGPLERSGERYEHETIQQRYESYAKQGNVKLEDLDENTRFIFFRDDPFRRFMQRTNEWMDIMMFIMNLNFQQDKFKFVFVYTQLERVNEMAIQQKAIEWEKVFNMDHMAKELPFVSWELYLNYLRKNQGVHESEQPEVVFDELVLIQIDENLGRDRIKAFEQGDAVGHSHEANVECYPHGYKLEEKQRKNRERQWTGNFWAMREGLRAKKLSCHSFRGSMNAMAPYFVNSNSSSIVIDAKNCANKNLKNCIDVNLLPDTEHTSVEWRTFSMERLTAPLSLQWHVMRNFEFSDAIMEDSKEYTKNAWQDKEFVSLVYYSQGNEEHSNYVELQKKKYDVDHVYIQTLRADQEELDNYNKLSSNVHMMSILETANQRAYTPEEIEIYGYIFSVQAKSFLGMVNCPMTELVFKKRAVNFKTDSTNFMYSCLSLKCKTGYGIEKRMARYSPKYWTQTELEQFEKLKAAQKDEL